MSFNFKLTLDKKALRLLGGNNPVSGATSTSKRAAVVGIGVGGLVILVTPMEDYYNDCKFQYAKKEHLDLGAHMRSFNDQNPFSEPQQPLAFEKPDKVLFPGSINWWNSKSSTPFLGRVNNMIFGDKGSK